MNTFLIGVHCKIADAATARREIEAVFGAKRFPLRGDQPLMSVVEDEDLLPEGDDWYGVVVSDVSGAGWVSVYVADWPDSGALALALSQRLGAPVLEIWVAEEHWGYTYFEAGAVRDRFADAPETVSETPDEAALYLGRPARLEPILRAPVAEAEAVLQQARAHSQGFTGAVVDAFAALVGLPFGHAFTSYDSFFDDDPEDYVDDLEHGPQFRHLAFALPPGREGLSE